MTILWAVLTRDLQLAYRQGSSAFLGVGFFALVVTLVPLGVGPERDVLLRIAPGILWIGAALSSLISLDRLFHADAEDGSLDLLLTLPVPLELIVLSKTAAHWITSALPLVLISPFLALMMGLPGEAMVYLVLSLLVGSPALSFLGAIGAALTVNTRRGGLLLSVLVLPLYIPTLIFGVQSVGGAPGLDVTVGPDALLASMAILAAITLISAVLSTWAAAAALRINAN